MATERREGITVVIPVWGSYVGRWLDDAVASVRDQNTSCVVVVVDNANHPPLKPPAGTVVIRSERPLSLGAARNLGLEAVETDLTISADADDVLLPGSLDALEGEMRANPGLAACAARIVEHDSRSPHHWPRPITARLSDRPWLFSALNVVSSLYPTTATAVRTELALDAGGFPDVDGGDDWVLGVSIAFRGRVRILDRPVRCYRIHPDSLSSGWRARPDIVEHARAVRTRLRDDPGVPRWAKAAIPAFAVLQHLVLLVVRPISRALSGRSQSGTGRRKEHA